MELPGVMDALHNYFRSRGISTEGLTVILNMTDRNAAIALDSYLQRELSTGIKQPINFRLDVRKFELCGLKVHIESPVHER